jgi:hypothetical protein
MPSDGIGEFQRGLYRAALLRFIKLSLGIVRDSE